MIHKQTPAGFFKHLLAGRNRAPLFGQWELTYRCNLKCTMCYTECYDTPNHIQKELAREEILRIVDEMAKESVFQLTLTGGEALAHPCFEDIYTHIVKKGIRVIIFTNGTLINARIARLWTILPPQDIEISLHGLKNTFDGITGVTGSFGRCMQGVRLLVQNKIPFTFKTLGMTLNKKEILEIKAFAESFENAHWFLGEQIRSELNGSQRPLQYQLAQTDFGNIASGDNRLLEEHEKITEVLKRERAFSEEEKRTQSRCGSNYKFHIDPYGGLQLCSANRRKTYDLRTGSFRKGFYEVLPSFPCPKKGKHVNSERTLHLSEALNI